jgi:hypothetical protein
VSRFGSHTQDSSFWAETIVCGCSVGVTYICVHSIGTI